MRREEGSHKLLVLRYLPRVFFAAVTQLEAEICAEWNPTLPVEHEGVVQVEGHACIQLVPGINPSS